MTVLIDMVTRLFALFPVLSPWETCALNLIDKHQPSSVSFICRTADHCPGNDFHKVIRHTPLQTIFGLQTDEFPFFKDTDLVFLPIHEDNIEWKNETIQKYLRGGHNFFKLVIVASMRNSSEEDTGFMSSLFGDLWKSGIINGAVLLKNESTSLMFAYSPFRSNDSCEDTSPVMIGECTQVAETVFDSKVINLNTCPLTVSIADDKPWLQRKPFIGRYKPLLEELAKIMNFTVKTTWPKAGLNGGICGPRERIGTKGDVATGKAHFTVGSFSRSECSSLEYLDIPYTLCLAWCTPVITENEYIFTFLERLFQFQVWAATILTMIVVVISVIIMCYYTSDRLVSSDFVYLVLVMFATVPLNLNYRSTPVRIILGFWLCACLVLRTAYESELKSQSSVPLATHFIKDLEGIVERVQSNTFKICTTKANLQVLESMDDLNVQFLYKRSNTCSDGMYRSIVRAALKRDRVIFTSDQRCRETAAEVSLNGPPLVSPKTGGCIKLVQLVPIVTLPGSPFRKTFSRFQHWTFDSGLFYKWTETKSGTIKKKKVRPLELKNILPALFVLFLGCSVGSLILMVEIFLTMIRFESIFSKILSLFSRVRTTLK